MRLVRVKRYALRWANITIREALAPFISQNGIFRFLATVALIFLMLQNDGIFALAEHFFSLHRWLLSFIYAIPAFVLWSMVRGAFLARTEERRSGEWHGERFIYHAPLHVLTTLVTPADNDRVKLFRVKDAESESFVETKIEIDRHDDRVKAQVTWPNGKPLMPWMGISKVTRTTLRLHKKKQLGLVIHAEPETDPTTIRVYVTSWKVTKGVLTG